MTNHYDWSAIAVIVAAVIVIGIWLREIFRPPVPAAEKDKRKAP